jgi:hypothetical protein
VHDRGNADFSASSRDARLSLSSAIHILTLWQHVSQ